MDHHVDDACFAGDGVPAEEDVGGDVEVVRQGTAKASGHPSQASRHDFRFTVLGPGASHVVHHHSSSICIPQPKPLRHYKKSDQTSSSSGESCRKHSVQRTKDSLLGNLDGCHPVYLGHLEKLPFLARQAGTGHPKS